MLNTGVTAQQNGGPRLVRSSHYFFEQELKILIYLSIFQCFQLKIYLKHIEGQENMHLLLAASVQPSLKNPVELDGNSGFFLTGVLGKLLNLYEH